MSLDRRALLKLGVGSGVLLGLPFPRSSRVHAAGAYPTRLVLIFNPNGTIADAFWPTPGASEQDFAFNTITQPLAPFRDKLLFLKGLTNRVASIGPGGPHQKGVGGLFTGRELQSGTFRDGCGSQAGWANGISVDQEAARYMGQTTFLPSLELGVRASQPEVRGRISYAGPGAPVPPINSPAAVYERLFSSFTQTDDARKDERRLVTEVVNQQYADFMPRASRADQLKLQQHLDLLRAIERRLDISVDTAGCLQPALPPAFAEDSEDTMSAITSLQIQLLATSFACDLTRIASLQFSTAVNDIRFPWLGSLGSGHTLSHAGPSNTAARNELILRGTWHAQQVAALMSALAALPEGEGTVLDNTIIVWANELGRGDLHTHDDLPFVVAGGCGGYFRMGRMLQFGGKSHTGLLVSLLNAMGISSEMFGHPEFAEGPLPGLV